MAGSTPFKDIFSVKKPVIGVVHLLPLPGSPRFSSSMEEILERAVHDAKAYVTGGVDGLIIENYGDTPFYPGQVGPETVSAMTHIASRIKSDFDIPIGIQVLRNDARAALAIAKVIGGQFIRVNVLTEAMVTDQGIIEPKAYELLRFRKFLDAEDIKIFADVHVKHAALLAERDIADSAEDLALRSLGDAIIVTGTVTGRRTNIRDIERVRTRKTISDIPLIVGGGVHIENVNNYFPIVDGIIIGTGLKVDNVTTNPVDVTKVEEFMRRMNSLRNNNNHIRK